MRKLSQVSLPVATVCLAMAVALIAVTLCSLASVGVATLTLSGAATVAAGAALLQNRRTREELRAAGNRRSDRSNDRFAVRELKGVREDVRHALLAARDRDGLTAARFEWLVGRVDAMADALAEGTSERVEPSSAGPSRTSAASELKGA
jgi:hypothetical protein